MGLCPPQVRFSKTSKRGTLRIERKTMVKLRACCLLWTSLFYYESKDIWEVFVRRPRRSSWFCHVCYRSIFVLQCSPNCWLRCVYLALQRRVLGSPNQTRNWNLKLQDNNTLYLEVKIRRIRTRWLSGGLMFLPWKALWRQKPQMISPSVCILNSIWKTLQMYLQL